jgi:hypothetical protein
LSLPLVGTIARFAEREPRLPSTRWP